VQSARFSRATWFSLWLILLLLGLALVARLRSRSRQVNVWLNVLAIGWSLLPLLQVTLDLATRLAVSRTFQPVSAPSSASVWQGPVPDIYYIILDGYARNDVLKAIYDYDNQAFLDRLTQKGFFVATSSRTNYSQTIPSLASSLNMTYLDDVARQMSTAPHNRWPAVQMIHDSAVVRFLKQRGYQFVAVASAYSGTEFQSADVCAQPPASLTYFQNMLLGATPLVTLFPNLQYDIHRDRILFSFRFLQEFRPGEAPVFLLAHIVSPHPPFVFEEDGSSLYPLRPFSLIDGSHYLRSSAREEYRQGYIRQLLHVSQLIEETVDIILASSQEPPVIILQADHGPGSMLDWENVDNTNLQERLSILNAYYLPQGKQTLYDTISPVNTFRVVLNACLGTHLVLLPDTSHFSTASHPYEFVACP